MLDECRFRECVCDLGRYNVVLDECHFRDVLHQLVSPPPATVCTSFLFLVASLIYLYFSLYLLPTWEENSCSCHLKTVAVIISKQLHFRTVAAIISKQLQLSSQNSFSCHLKTVAAVISRQLQLSSQNSCSSGLRTFSGIIPLNLLWQHPAMSCSQAKFTVLGATRFLNGQTCVDCRCWCIRSSIRTSHPLLSTECNHCSLLITLFICKRKHSLVSAFCHHHHHLRHCTPLQISWWYSTLLA